MTTPGPFRFKMLIVAGLLVMMMAAAAGAAQAPAYDLGWHVLAGGGSRSALPAIAIDSTAGQALTGWTSGIGVGFRSGYWQAWGHDLPRPHAYLPVVVKQSP